MENANDQEGAALDAALSRLGIELDDGRKSLLLGHLHLLERKNEQVNLTRIVSIDEAIVLHVEDSLSVLGEFGHAEGAFCDIGTGGGFPGLPLAIASGRSGVLLDSVKKKARAVQEFVEELGLSGQLRVAAARSEELALEEPGRYDTVVARAVSSLPAVEELATPLLRYGGRLIAMRGRESDEQLSWARGSASKLGLELVSSRDFEIGPDDGIHRSVFVFERVHEPSVSLPRRAGMAQKRPLR